MTSTPEPCLAHCEHGDRIPRDRWRRPLIDGRPLLSPSTVAKKLDDNSNLIKWIGRNIAVGMSLPTSEDLRELALSHRDDSKTLNDVAERAKERAGGSSAASRGTALHAVIAEINLGRPMPADLTPATIKSVDAYRRKLDELKLTPVYVEQFVADLELGIGGTFDVVLEDADRVRYMADVKSGAKAWERTYPLPVAIQLSSYAAGRRYCPELGDLGPHGANLDNALLLSVPIDSASCTVDVIDIAKGRTALSLALEVYEVAKWKPNKGELVGSAS